MSKEFNIINLTSIASQLETNGAQNFVFNPVETVEQIKFEIRQGKINDDMIEVYLNLLIESTKKESGEPAYRANTVYAGVFNAKGFEGEELEQLVHIHCATILYPLCRERLINSVSHTPFPISIPPVLDFARIYQDQKASKEENKEQENKEESTNE